MFSTRSANDVFAAKFTDPLRAVLAGNISDSGPVSETVGRLWSAAEIALEQLPEAEAHKATEGAPLADDVKDAVSATTEALWRAVDPKARPASGEPFILQKRLSSFEKACKSSMADTGTVCSFSCDEISAGRAISHRFGRLPFSTR